MHNLFVSGTFHTIIINRHGEIAHSSDNNVFKAMSESGWDTHLFSDCLVLQLDGKTNLDGWYINNLYANISDYQALAARNHAYNFHQVMQDNVEYLQYFNDEKYEDVRIILAAISKNADILTALAKDASITIRSCVALNEHTPVEVLSLLATDNHAYVRSCVAKHPSLSNDIFQTLANDNNSEVSIALVSNRNIPFKILEQIIAQDKICAFAEIARNPSTPKYILKTLLSYNITAVNAAIANNRSSSPQMLDTLAKSNEYWIRAAVAENSSTAQSTLEFLSNDIKKYVRQNLLLNPNISSKLKSELMEYLPARW